MAGETGGGGGEDLPLRAPLISFPGWDRGDPIYNENGPFLLFLDCFSAIAIIVGIGGFGPFETLGTLYLEGPQGLVPSTSGIISPALASHQSFSPLPAISPHVMANIRRSCLRAQYDRSGVMRCGNKMIAI